MNVSYGGVPRYLPGGFTANIFPSGLSARGTSARPASNASARSAQAYIRSEASSATSDIAAASPRAENAWTDPAPAARGDSREANALSGTILYPGAFRDVPLDRFTQTGGTASGLGGYGRNLRLRQRFYSDPYGYNYPYAISGGYAPYIYNDIADVGMSDGGSVSSVADSNDLSTDAARNLSQPYASESPGYILPPADAPGQAPDAAPASPDGSARALRSNTGPDSLVEAVQAELARRGYFGGKVDAVYNEATHAALKRFQSDQQLSATGRINEATLHALQLD